MTPELLDTDTHNEILTGFANLPTTASHNYFHNVISYYIILISDNIVKCTFGLWPFTDPQARTLKHKLHIIKAPYKKLPCIDQHFKLNLE